MTPGETYHCVGFNVLGEVWDYSSIEAGVQCDGQDAVFTITNVGEPMLGDMDGPSEYRVYRNDVLEDTVAFQLAGGESIQVVVFADGDSIRVEADQRPGHPNVEVPAQAEIDNCLMPPDAVDDLAETVINVPVDIDILDNDTDVDGTIDPTSVTITLPPTDGTLLVDPVTGVVTYTPDVNFVGTDFFIYEVCDNDGSCDTANVNVVVNPYTGGGRIITNIPPTANDDTAATEEDTPVEIDVAANDTDPEGYLDASTVVIVGPASDGTLDVDTVTGAVTYTPDPGFVGANSFLYKICDTEGLCDVALVTVDVLSAVGVLPAVQLCGNGILEEDEECDDGNRIDGDGCDAYCAIEPFVPAGPVCGNGILEEGEECDDGNMTAGDGCTASCTVELPAAAAVCGNGVVETGEMCDDGNLIDGDGCGSSCVLEIPLVVPLEVIVPPPPAPVLPFGISSDYCLDRIYDDANLTFIGTVDFAPGAISSLKYSQSNGLSWNPIPNYTSSPGGSVFNLDLYDLQAGAHSVVVRVTYTDGSIFDSPVCSFRVRGELGFGAIQWLLQSQQSPLSVYGFVELRVNEPAIFYLEAQGASYALVRNMDTGEEYPLTYNEDLKLWWSNSIVFTRPGTYRLEAEVGNIFGETYVRRINTAVIVASAGMTTFE